MTENAESGDLTPRPSSLPRDLTEWSLDALESLFEGDDEFALYATQADHEMVFFAAHDRCWCWTRPPSDGWSQAAPEVVEDWLGATAPKEPGAEPVLMHREELNYGAQGIVSRTVDDPPKHVYEKWEEMDL